MGQDSDSYLLRSMDTGRLLLRNERHIRKIKNNQEPEEEKISLVTSLVTSSILKSHPQSQNHRNITGITQDGKEVEKSSQGTVQQASPPAQGADQASHLGHLWGTALNLALPTPSQAPSPGSGPPHSPPPPSRRRVKFSEVVAVIDLPGCSVFTLHS